ncbi:hypothetical protein PSN45_002707 [Yamadazyma tenuis]|uniref:uncharacterized protein n=1 Tax=Candida tenuis TaxID=2315449 RepID=UPI00279DDA7C|nr:hypothetical protein PSN45_002707 [Yamadazyma tenuis]
MIEISIEPSIIKIALVLIFVTAVVYSDLFIKVSIRLFIYFNTCHLRGDVYEYLDYRSIFPDHLPLEYRQFANLLASFGSNSFKYDEISCLSVYENLNGTVKQLESCMITASVRYGILCDGYHLIPVEFNGNFYVYENDEPVEGVRKLTGTQELRIPFKSRILNVHNSGPIFLEGLIYTLHKAKKEGPEALKFYQKLPVPLVLNDNPLPTNPKGNDDEDDNADETEDNRPRSSYDRLLKPRVLDNYNVDPKPSMLTPPNSPSSIDSQQHSHHKSDFKWLTYTSGAELLQRSIENDTTVYKVKARYMKDVILEEIDE